MGDMNFQGIEILSSRRYAEYLQGRVLTVGEFAEGMKDLVDRGQLLLLELRGRYGSDNIRHVDSSFVGLPRYVFVFGGETLVSREDVEDLLMRTGLEGKVFEGVPSRQENYLNEACSC